MTRIAVDPGRVAGHLDRNVFGGFIEHLGRCIYGGIYDEGSSLAWPHRVADLGPFTLVDAAATVSADRRRVALTLVNRSPDEPESAQIVLRDHAFDGAAAIRTVTANPDPGAGPLPGIEGVHLSEGSETPRCPHHHAHPPPAVVHRRRGGNDQPLSGNQR